MSGSAPSFWSVFRVTFKVVVSLLLMAAVVGGTWTIFREPLTDWYMATFHDETEIGRTARHLREIQER